MQSLDVRKSERKREGDDQKKRKREGNRNGLRRIKRKRRGRRRVGCKKSVILLFSLFLLLFIDFTLIEEKMDPMCR